MESQNTAKWPNEEEYAELKQKAMSLAQLTFSGLEASSINQKEIFGDWSELCAVARKVDIVDGLFFQSVSQLVLSACPHLQVLESGLKLPVTSAAMKVIKSNTEKERTDIKLVADEREKTTYTPDHLVRNNRTGILHMMELKRTVGNYGKGSIKALSNKMQAAGLTARDVIYNDHGIDGILGVRVNIIDCSEEDHAIPGVRKLSELDEVFQIDVFNRLIPTLNAETARLVSQRLTHLFNEHTAERLKLNSVTDLAVLPTCSEKEDTGGFVGFG